MRRHTNENSDRTDTSSDGESSGLRKEEATWSNSDSEDESSEDPEQPRVAQWQAEDASDDSDSDKGEGPSNRAQVR